MNNRERIINCVLGNKIDRTPFIPSLGPWGETLARWKSEGAKDDNAWLDVGFDEGIFLLTGCVNHYFEPMFEFKIISEDETSYVYQDYLGVINKSNKGVSAIPNILKNPVTCMDDWQKIKEERLKPDFACRIPQNFSETCKEIKASGKLVQAGAFPFGLFGCARDLIGVEELMFKFYDEPELIHDIMDYLTDFWLGIYAEMLKYIQIDAIHIWEDMSGKQGCLISPQMMEEFMMPNYRKIKKFADENNIPILMVDTDGVVRDLIPIFLDSGVNYLMPFEVRAGNDIVALRNDFPQMCMVGGIDKMEIAKGQQAIDRELSKIAPLLGKPGFIPTIDHTINPEISYFDYQYFTRKLREMIFQFTA